MTVKQKCLDIIDLFPPEQLTNVAVSLEAMYKLANDVDDAYCLELFRNSFDEDNDEPECFEEFVGGIGLRFR